MHKSLGKFSKTPFCLSHGCYRKTLDRVSAFTGHLFPEYHDLYSYKGYRST